ncbi:MAG: NADPH:quinone oxidoreductase family protein [Betaproteobacteria bacterium]|nr:NADPH:quinone oxidoreductase family protein [Betaproteobacteria bacterium]
MKALIVHEHGPLDNLKLEDAADPAPGPGQVLVDVHAASVNFPDLLVIGGTYQVLPPRPFIPGKDMAGVVAAVGPGITAVKPGDRVAAQNEYGAYAQKCVVPQHNCYPMPDAMSFEDAAAMGIAYPTAHFALVERGQYRPGEIVLVNGAAGGVGIATIQVAKALGATVVASVGSAEKAALAKQHGADHVVRTDVPNIRDAFREQVIAAVGKRGVDIIVDPVGGDVFDAGMRVIAWSGRIIVVGFAEGRIPEVKAGHLLVKNISLIGLQYSSYRDRQPEKVQRVQRELFEWYVQGKIRPHVMGAWPLPQYREALDTVRERKVVGKVVIRMR